MSGQPSPVAGCSLEYPPRGRLMCAEHWRRLPPALSSQVHRTYLARLKALLRLRARRTTAEVFAGTAERHQGACW